MGAGQPDPRALEVAQELHRAEQPEITILFGSRARGDYREGRSDVDIMLVQESPPTEAQERRTRDRAQAAGEARYGRRTPVQIIWKTFAEFSRMRRTINHVVAKALRDGIVMPRDPESYRNSYHDDDYEYEWTVTDERVRHAEQHRRAFNLVIESGLDDIMIGQHAHSAMEHALKALISAKGQSYPHVHDINVLIHDARRADPDFKFEPEIDGSVYDRYAGRREYEATQWRISDIPGYREVVNGEVAAILTRVAEVRRGR